MAIPKATGENFKVRAGEMEGTAMAAVISLAEKGGLVDLPTILQHRVTHECLSIFNVNGTYRKAQKSKLVEKFSLQSVNIPSPYTALIDMGMIWRMATPTAEDVRNRMVAGTPGVTTPTKLYIWY
jgi:hypothetical protein